MAKICKRCKKPQSREGLFLCDRNGCKGEFIDESELISHLSNDDINLIARRVVKTWRFWGLLFGAVAVTVPASFLAIAKFWIQPAMQRKVLEYQTNANQKVAARVEASIEKMYTETSNRLVGVDESLRRLDTNVHTKLIAVFQDVTNQIRLQFEDSRIKNTMSEVASLHAKELMEQRVAPQVLNSPMNWLRSGSKPRQICLSSGRLQILRCC